jgi:transcriptional regulator GlxA family with amidase domain
MLRTVSAVLIDDVAPFEFGVVCEVFGIDRTADGVPAFDFRVCGEHPGESLSTSVGVRFTPEHGLDALEDADLVAVPAARVRDEYPVKVLEALLGEIGLLDGRDCTVHWYHAADFAQRFPLARVDPNVLFVDDGQIITSAGTAAGIDACLHLVRRELGAQVASIIARRMVVPPQREGGQRQFIEQPIPPDAESLQPLLTWMLDTIDTEHPVALLAKRAQLSERTFARRFLAETGTTPHRWLSAQRVLHARRLLEQTQLSIDEIAQRCGFGSAALLRHHFHRAAGVTPTDYRRTFACESSQVADS